MKLAVNYSLPMGKLLVERAVDCDLLKCPEWHGVIKTASKLKPVCVHFEILVGSGAMKRLDYTFFRSLLESTATPHINCHLSGNPQLDPHSAQDQQAQIQAWVADMRWLQGQLPGVALVAENLPCVPQTVGSEIGSQAALIRAAIEQSGAYLLLDLSHARITCANLGLDLEDYIASLPTERLRELHITGIRRYHGRLTDHFEMTTADWQAALWAREQIRRSLWREPEIVAFEYGGVGDVFGWRTEEEVLRVQVPKLMQIFSRR